MSNIPSVFEGLIQEQETEFKAAVSEYTARRMGSNLNFIHSFYYLPGSFKVNGMYSSGIASSRLDGFVFFESNAEIIDIVVLNGDAGTGGTTELDVLHYTTSGGTGTSIFTTTPKITSAAPNNTRFQIGSVATGVTAPVMTSNPFNVNAGDWLEMKMVTSMTGAPRDIMLIPIWRPR